MSVALASAFAPGSRAGSRVRAVLSSPYFWMVVTALVLFFFFAASAHAGTASDSTAGALPWEGPLKKIRDSISGPVAFAIALLGIIACGATLIWGGEVSEFTRRIIYVVLVVCIIVFANAMLTTTIGAVVPTDANITASDLAAYAQAKVLPASPCFGAGAH